MSTSRFCAEAAAGPHAACAAPILFDGMGVDRANRMLRTVPGGVVATAGAVLAGLVFIGVVVVGFGLALPGWAQAAAGESIRSYDTHIQVRSDGKMQVVETITYDFGGNQRHGIIRRIPARFRYDDRRDRLYAINGVTVTVDGRAAADERSSANGEEIFKDRRCEPHHHRRPHLRGQLPRRRGAQPLRRPRGAVLERRRTEWTVPISQASATITGPAAVVNTQCFAGPQGSHLGCAAKSAAGDTATFRQPSLAPGSGLSAVVAFPAGSIATQRRSSSTGRTWAPRFGRHP